MLVFGDSLSDVGNSYIFSGKKAPGEPYYEGRFSNGRLWIEVFAEGMGFEGPKASLAGGNNYAFGGARTGDGDRGGKPDIGQQIDLYLEKSGGRIGKRELVVVSGGCNDFIRGNPVQTIPNIVNHITKLAGAGGRVFLVTNFPPLGGLPVFTHELPVMVEASVLECLEGSVDPEIQRYLESKVGPRVASYLKRWIPSAREYLPSIKSYLPVVAEEFAKKLGGYMGGAMTFENAGEAALAGASAVSGMYNAYLELALSDVERRLGVKIYRLDVNRLFLDVAEEPERYGFRYVNVPALDAVTHKLGDGVDADEYVFFDGIHPVGKTHGYLGERALALFKKR